MLQFSLCLLYLLSAATAASVDFPRSPCPFVPKCNCVNSSTKWVECQRIDSSISSTLLEQYPLLEKLSISGWDYGVKELDLAVFSRFRRLKELRLTDGKLRDLQASSVLSNLEVLDLSRNRISSFSQFCNISENLPSLESLLVSENSIAELPSCLSSLSISVLDVSNNKLVSTNISFPRSLERLNLAENTLEVVQNVPGQLIALNLSGNPLSNITFPNMPKLRALDLSRTNLEMMPPINSPELHNLAMDETTMVYVDWTAFLSPRLRRISLRDSSKLAFISGQLPSTVTDFVLTNAKISALPLKFFAKTTISHLDLSGIIFDCNKCTLEWARPVRQLLEKKISCTLPSSTPEDCSIGISPSQPSTFFGKHGGEGLVSCNVYGDGLAEIEWWLYRPATYLGTFIANSGVDFTNVSSSALERYTVLPGGALKMHHVNRTFVERYVCIARNSFGNDTGIVKFRLDYRDWYSLSLFDSVFWGALAFTIVVCAFSFILNITWILTRKSILWWIQRAERLSRVRKMVEAMEKYRVRQMESLQEKYTRRIQLVRDNYHNQVEQLRVSYASQAEKFRDYRAAQMETVTSHIENIRDNYQMQMNRMREYGSKRAEMLWESYERQVNRMKTFSLQHRLKLMRQYKVKQRHLNKLLESFTDHFTAEDLKKHEEEVRAALELPEAVAVPDPLSRSSSFYSLPEYVLDEEGTLRPSPLVPNVRFTRTPDFRFPKDGSQSESNSGRSKGADL